MAVSKTKVANELDKKAEKVVRIRNVHVGVDKSYQDVLDLQSEGHNIYFNEDEDFIELTQEQVSGLSLKHKQRYRMAKQMHDGIFDMASTVNAVAGYDMNLYDKRPGSSTDKLRVYGKEKGWDYTFVREDSQVRFEREGWIADTNPKTKTSESKNDTCATTHIGGQRNSEMTLYRIPTTVHSEIKSKRKDIRVGMLKKSQDSARDTILRAGAKILDE